MTRALIIDHDPFGELTAPAHQRVVAGRRRGGPGRHSRVFTAGPRLASKSIRIMPDWLRTKAS